MNESQPTPEEEISEAVSADAEADRLAWEELKSEALERLKVLFEERNALYAHEQGGFDRAANFKLSTEIDSYLSDEALVGDEDFRTRFNALEGSDSRRLDESSAAKIVEEKRLAKEKAEKDAELSMYHHFIYDNIGIFREYDRAAQRALIEQNNLQNNREFIRVAFREWGPSVFAVIGDEAMNDREFWLDLAVSNPANFYAFPDKWRFDEELKRAALRKNPELERFVKIDKPQGVGEVFDPQKSPMHEAYALLGATTPLELSKNYTRAEQPLFIANEWDYDNPEQIQNKIRVILESVYEHELTDEEKEWKNEILWFWYHHAISVSDWKRDKEKMQEFSTKALKYQHNNPNILTRAMNYLSFGMIHEAEDWINMKAGDPDEETAREMIENYKKIGWLWPGK